MVHRHSQVSIRSGGVWQRMLNGGREMMGGVDHFFRSHGAHIKQAAMMAAPMLARSNPALAAGVAAVGEASGGYADLRNQLGD